MSLLRQLSHPIFLAGLLFSGVVMSQDVTITLESEPAETIDYGIGLYLDGNLRDAKIALQTAASAASDRGQENEALIYLAEIEYYLGERDAAWLTCQRIVQNDENYRPDPLVHPPEMLVFYESARLATVEPSTNTVSTTVTNAPARNLQLLSIMPGVPQYMRGNHRLGLATGVTFTALSVASLVLWSAMRTYDSDSTRQGVQVHTNDDLEMAERLLTLTELTRFGAAGIWITSLVQELAIRPSISLVNSQPTTSVIVSGSW